MIPYFIFIIAIIIAYFRKSHRAMFVIMTLFAALRYEVGWDYAAYINICSDAVQLETAKEVYSRVWYELFNFCYQKKIPEFAIIITACITQFCVYKAFLLFHENDDKRIAGDLLFYICWPFFYLNSFSIIRQSLAVAVILMAFAYMYRKSHIKSIVLYIFGVYLHPTAIVALPVLLVLEKRKALNIGAVVLVVLFGIMALARVELFMPLFGKAAEYYDYYLEQTDTFGSLLVYLLVMISAFLLLSYVRAKDKYSLHIRLCSIVLIAFIIEIAMSLSPVSSVLSRVMFYFTTLMCLIFFDCLSEINSSKFINVLAVLLLGSLFIFYLIFTDNPDAIVSSGYVPYKTLFEL